MTLVWRPGFQFDADASTYIEAVEAADTQALETGVRYAINDFVIGCKQDGIWSAIKASCILAGARTLNGCLVPLVGTAPTSYNFVAGDYNRETGLKGNGSTKYLDSNRNNNADPQNDKHLCVYISTLSDQSGVYKWSLGDSGFTVLGQLPSNNHYARINDASVSVPGASSPEPGFIGANRANGSSKVLRLGSINYLENISSSTPGNANIFVFSRNVSGSTGHSNARLAFYSIGESLDLALLDARVTDLVNAIGAAIP
jgi:hypothetical protein